MTKKAVTNVRNGQQPHVDVDEHLSPAQIFRPVIVLAAIYAAVVSFIVLDLPFLNKIIPEFRSKADELVIAFGVVIWISLLTIIPSLMVLSYRQIQKGRLKTQIQHDLHLCGIGAKDVSGHLDDFDQRNSLKTFVFPMLLNVATLFLLWDLVFAPNGLVALAESLRPANDKPIAKELLSGIVDDATFMTWAFLGAYFYFLTVLTRRWLRSDITTGLLWGANVRLLLALVVGLLLMKVLDQPNDATNIQYVILAFLAGISPDLVLGWLTDFVKSPVGFLKGNRSGIFKRRDLEKKLEGISFWQAERLAEESIDSVQNLATKEIPNLLVRTRFDTPTLLYWIDQALLHNQVGDETDAFKRAYIKTASDLFDAIGSNEERIPEVARLIAHAQGKEEDAENSAQISEAMLRNLVRTLEIGPNLTYIQNYWGNTRQQKQ